MLPEVDGQLVRAPASAARPSMLARHSPICPSQDTASTSLPFQTAPHDALREGLCSLKSDAAPVHPVEKIQRQASSTEDQPRLSLP